MKHILMTAALLMCAGMSRVMAQVATPHITHQQVRQHQRIAHGKANQSLNSVETRRLCKQQKRIRQHKRIARADGQVTMQEHARINRHQRRASVNIHRKKHNGVN